eukprot:9505270-Prorocentrum_lima.AAC.1
MQVSLAAEPHKVTEEYHSQRPLVEKIAALQPARKAVSGGASSKSPTPSRPRRRSSWKRGA